MISENLCLSHRSGSPDHENDEDNGRQSATTGDVESPNENDSSTKETDNDIVTDSFMIEDGIIQAVSEVVDAITSVAAGLEEFPGEIGEEDSTPIERSDSGFSVVLSQNDGTAGVPSDTDTSHSRTASTATITDGRASPSNSIHQPMTDAGAEVGAQQASAKKDKNLVIVEHTHGISSKGNKSHHQPYRPPPIKSRPSHGEATKSSKNTGIPKHLFYK